jgi:Carboxypeptidase regulatory-like domain/Secretion system C-terminal sorting domain
MKITLFFSALWLGFSALFFQPAAVKTELGGVVKNALTQAPLADATLTLYRLNKVETAVKTDTAGRYKIQTEAGLYTLECQLKGFTLFRVTEIRVEKDKPLTIDVNINPATELEEAITVDHGTVERRSLHAPTDAVGALSRVAHDHKSAPLTSETIGYGSGRGEKARSKSPTKSVSPAAVKKESGDAKDAYYMERAPAKPDAPVEKIIEPAAPPPTDAEIATFDDLDKSFKEEKAGETSAPGTPKNPAPRAGLLTAGEWNDLHNWSRHWLDLLHDGEVDAHQKQYGIFPKHRYTVLLTNEHDYPLTDAPVTLKTAGGEIVWETRTDNTGKAELWAGLFDQKVPGALKAEASVGGRTHDLGVLLPAGEGGLNRRRIAVECGASRNVDIVWAVDATGSMGDEIEYLKTELLDVIGSAKGVNPDLSFRMGTVFYRDKGDEYLTKSSGLSYDVSKTVDFIRKQFAGGGGDYPEAVHSALEDAIFRQKWSEHAVARICFLVLDASPHSDVAVNESLQRSIREAARRGIRIVPVTASGIQKDTEFLMKFFGLATNGTYVFLTDHSGIGGKHLEPTSEEYKVEPLNRLLVRLITEYTSVETCEGKSLIRFNDPQQPAQSWQAQYFPNPAVDQLNLDLPVQVQSVVVYDSEGKVVRKIENPSIGLNTIALAGLPEGFYTIRIQKDNLVQSGKLAVIGK